MPKKEATKKKRSQPKWAKLPPKLKKEVRDVLSKARNYVAKQRKYNKPIK
jgi:hypothetical protein